MARRKKDEEKTPEKTGEETPPEGETKTHPSDLPYKQQNPATPTDYAVVMKIDSALGNGTRKHGTVVGYITLPGKPSQLGSLDDVKFDDKFLGLIDEDGKKVEQTAASKKEVATLKANPQLVTLEKIKTQNK